MGFVLTCTCPPSSSLLVVSQLHHRHQFSAGVKSCELWRRPHELSSPPTRRTLISKPRCFNLPQEPILSEALKEPIAFVGGMFAGLLRLDLNEEPLKDWVTRTVEASGIMEEGVDADGTVSNDEEAPQQIEIE
ncbi:PREDICTED: UPF0426 protein At1g28150, chloroplastic-like [Camelina sativa]|uniref:UPF0426 protein At1g28150, chloroplastic-like n=1 Tax=Camelina sativa TaxID=90675 RepID=A0ABM0VSS7_CAMSA|nr:PREDICTED: UPF0426 protein At1g28150, chloroplastic-like [Camelina sativa]XP_010460590.1 PREDICTED: UPF0426 protein At1g28150, chloroplastic-like [Camelina sativa]